jgi:2-(1,2-epoxy-1,2-dihydrophenyl)acetyl-CoA isomerase
MTGTAETPREVSGVRFDVADGIAVIVLDDPETKNSLNDDIGAAIRGRLAEWAVDAGIRGLVLTGAGGAFSSGGRLDMIERKREEARADGARERIAEGMLENARLVELLREFPAPTVAAVDGACVGAAIGWACACDLRIASERAKFITGFAKVGLSTDFGTSRLLAEAVGRGRAANWLLTSPLVTADEALAAGLVLSVHPEQNLLNAARELIGGLNPRASVAIRANLDDAVLPLGDALTREAGRFARLL